VQRGLDQRVEETVRLLTVSFRWRALAVANTATNSNFVLGLVLFVVSTQYPDLWCASLVLLLRVILVVYVAVLFSVAITFGRAFKDALMAERRRPRPAVRVGASRAAIESLPVSEHLPGHRERTPSMDSASCAVCLSDFERGEILRLLPCGHSFHKGCIDEWLSRSKACPLCVQDIDVPLGQRTSPPELRRRL